MAHSRTRPPNRNTDRGRPSKGPRLVPLSRDDQQRVTLLQEAAAHLRGPAGMPAHAEVIDFVLTPEGSKFVNRLNWTRRDEDIPNFAFQMVETLRDDIKAKAKVAGARLEAEAEHALKQFLAGRFTPARPEKYKHGQAPRKVNLNVRVPRELRQEADALGKQLLASGDLEWAPLASNVLTSYFSDRVEENFRNPIRKRYRARELWASTQCAEARGVSVAEWQRIAPEPVWVAQGDIPMWDPDDVAGRSEAE